MSLSRNVQVSFDRQMTEGLPKQKPKFVGALDQFINYKPQGGIRTCSKIRGDIRHII